MRRSSRDTDNLKQQNLEEFGMKIKKYRKTAGMTAEDLAKELGVAIGSVRNWECGMSRPDPTYLIRMFHVLDVDPNTFFEFRGAGEALAEKEIKCGWMTVSRMDGLGRYEGIERSAYNVFMNLPRIGFPDVFLFWDDFVAQGALTAFLGRGLRIPGDIKVVSLSNRGLGPVYSEALTRFECDASEAGEKVAAFALALLAKGRLPAPPAVTPHYVFGRTFPY